MKNLTSSENSCDGSKADGQAKLLGDVLLQGYSGYRCTACALNGSSYFAMKNTPKIGSMSNFWGAVHKALCLRGFLFWGVYGYAKTARAVTALPRKGFRRHDS
jgi:hypothetical protein